MKTLKIHSYYKAPKEVTGDNGVRFYFSGVYLHGKVERYCHYDICYPANPEDFSENIRKCTHHFASGDKTYKYLFLDGIFPCIVDDKYYCTAFLWYDDKYKNEHCWQRGLIVLNTDKDMMEDAMLKYNERAICL